MRMTPSDSPRRAPFVVRLFTSPVTPDAVERRLRRQLAPLLTWIWVGGLAALALFATWAGWTLWSARVPLLAPRHRPEALCFALAERPAFSPPVSIEPSAAVIHGSFPPTTPPLMALQSAMSFRDEMVVEARHRRVGDFEVGSVWLRLPEAGGSTHWLVIGWIENSDLAVCNFRFGGRGPVIDGDERVWGEWLMQRLLRPENFQAGALPRVRARIGSHASLPRFGPPPGS